MSTTVINDNNKPIKIYNTITVQAMGLGLILLAGLWAAPVEFWQGPQALHIGLEFISALLAIVVALGSIVRFIALGQRLFLLFGLSFLGAGLADMINATVSLDILSSGGGIDLSTWTAGRLTHGLLLLLSLIVGRWAGQAQHLKAELGVTLLITIILSAVTISVLSQFATEITGSEPTMLRYVSGWALVLLFFWSAWGYLGLHNIHKTAFYDWAAAAAVIFGVAQIYAALFANWQESSINIPHALKVFGYIAALTGLYMENLALFKETERQQDELDIQNRNLEEHNSELATLLAVTREIAEARDIGNLPQLVLDRAAALMPQTDTGILMIYDEQQERLVPKAARGISFQAISGMRLRPDESIPGHILTTGELYVNSSAEEIETMLNSLDPSNKALLDKATEDMPDVHQIIGAPLIEHGEAIGVMVLHDHTQQRHFTDQQKSFFQTLCNQVAGALRNAQLYVQIQGYTRQLQAKNQELESFVYTASHDLRSPLVSLHGLMAMFIKSSGPKLDERGNRYLTRLEANVSQMEELIDGLLELSRVGRAEVKIEEVDLNILVKELAEQLRPQFEKERIELVLNPLPVVGAPVIQMKQVFSNLLSNGIKYMGESEERRVEVGGERNEGGVSLYVQDTGIGIDPAYHDKVFVIFQRLKELEEAKGTGVGLAIVKKIIENLGGEIALESEKGKGSKFLITLPILEPEEEAETEMEIAES